MKVPKVRITDISLCKKYRRIVRQYIKRYGKNKPARCIRCNSWFLNFTTFRKHLTTHNILTKPGKYNMGNSCYYCHVKFKYAKNLSEHYILCHFKKQCKVILEKALDSKTYVNANISDSMCHGSNICSNSLDNSSNPPYAYSDDSKSWVSSPTLSLNEASWPQKRKVTSISKDCKKWHTEQMRSEEASNKKKKVCSVFEMSKNEEDARPTSLVISSGQQNDALPKKRPSFYRSKVFPAKKKKHSCHVTSKVVRRKRSLLSLLKDNQRWGDVNLKLKRSSFYRRKVHLASDQVNNVFDAKDKDVSSTKLCSPPGVTKDPFKRKRSIELDLLLVDNSRWKDTIMLPTKRASFYRLYTPGNIADGDSVDVKQMSVESCNSVEIAPMKVKRELSSLLKDCQRWNDNSLKTKRHSFFRRKDQLSLPKDLGSVSGFDNTPPSTNLKPKQNRECASLLSDSENFQDTPLLGAKRFSFYRTHLDKSVRQSPDSLPSDRMVSALPKKKRNKELLFLINDMKRWKERLKHTKRPSFYRIKPVQGYTGGTYCQSDVNSKVSINIEMDSSAVVNTECHVDISSGNSSAVEISSESKSYVQPITTEALSNWNGQKSSYMTSVAMAKSSETFPMATLPSICTLPSGMAGISSRQSYRSLPFKDTTSDSHLQDNPSGSYHSARVQVTSRNQFTCEHETMSGFANQPLLPTKIPPVPYRVPYMDLSDGYSNSILSMPVMPLRHHVTPAIARPIPSSRSIYWNSNSSCTSYPRDYLIRVPFHYNQTSMHFPHVDTSTINCSYGVKPT